MPFELSPMEEDDIPAFAAMDEAAVGNWAFARAMQHENPDQARHVFAEEWTRKSWGQDPLCHWLKVTDIESGDFVAAALWRLQLEEEKPKGENPIQGEATGVESKPGKTETDGSARPDFWADVGRMGKAFHAEFVGPRPHAHLQILVTHPKYQRNGAGSMLVKWGCDKADQHGIISCVQASEAGERLYRKHGFEIKKLVEFDLRPYGVEETALRRGMIREPSARS